MKMLARGFSNEQGHSENMEKRFNKHHGAKKKDFEIESKIRHANQLRPRRCDITPPESPEVIDLPFQDEVQPPRTERIIPLLTTPPMRTTSLPTERRKSSLCRATRLYRVLIRLNIEPLRKTYDLLC
uniref:Uncharacterized protein n=1 Tax=Heterorhabditis bacteriophora TaxID=37862 RepID=A0A1I7W6S8_HETBA